MHDRNRSTISRREVLSASVKTAGILALGGAALGPAWADSDRARQRWLVVASHPDDEAKATPLLRKERKPDDEAVVMIMRLCGEGRLQDRENWTREEAIATRSYEMQQAARFLKVELRWWLPPHPENPNIVATPETVAKMVALLKEIRPTRIAANWHEDSHPDHVGTGLLVREAVKQLQVPGGMPVYWFGTPGRPQAQPNFKPNHFVDVSDPPELAALLWSRMVHRSQTAYTVMRDYVQYHREHGEQAGTTYAAGYVLQRI